MKNKLVKTLLCCSLLGGVGIVGAAVENNNLQAVRAEDETVTEGVETHFNQNTPLTTANGTLPDISDFLRSSASGFAIEFKMQEGATVSNCVFDLYAGNTIVNTTSHMYMFRENNGAVQTKKKGFIYYSGGMIDNPNDDIGRIVELENGWLRFECMGYEFVENALFHKSTDYTKYVYQSTLDTSLNVDSLKFIWYDNAVVVRSVKRISSYTGKMTKDDDGLYSVKDWTTESIAAKGFLNDMPAVKNWKSSGDGFFIDIYGSTDASGNVHGDLRDNYITGYRGDQHAISNGFYLINQGVAGIGKLINMGTYKRYELMFADATAIAGKENDVFNSIYFDWYGVTVGARGIIDSYSYNFTTNVNGTESTSLAIEGVVEKPADPSVTGKHFVGWFTKDGTSGDWGEEFDFSVALTKDTTIYAKFADHNFSEFVSKDETSHTFKCECGEENTESHTFAETVTEAALKTAATCTEDAVYYKTCACGAKSDETFTATGTAGHTYGDLIPQVDPVFDTDGVKAHYECSVCHKVFDDQKVETTLDALKIEKTEAAVKAQAIIDVDTERAKYVDADYTINKSKLDNAVTTAKAAIESATTQDAVNAAVDKLKEDLEAVVSDDTIAKARADAKKAIDDEFNTYNPDEYTVNYAAMEALVEEMKGRIDTATVISGGFGNTINGLKQACLSNLQTYQSDAEIVTGLISSIDKLVSLENFDYEELTQAQYSAITSAWKSFNKLSDTLKAQVNNAAKLDGLMLQIYIYELKYAAFTSGSSRVGVIDLFNNARKYYVPSVMTDLVNAYNAVITAIQAATCVAEFDRATLANNFLLAYNSLMGSETIKNIEGMLADLSAAETKLSASDVALLKEIFAAVKYTKEYTDSFNDYMDNVYIPGNLAVNGVETIEELFALFVYYQLGTTMEEMYEYFGFYYLSIEDYYKEETIEAYEFFVDCVEVLDLIAAIGEVELTDACKAKIEAAEAAYAALSDAQKARVNNEAVVAARSTYDGLVAADNAAAVVAKINAIGEVEYTDASKALIDDARTAYDALTDAEKALVTADQLKVLTDAEEAYANLKTAAEQAANAAAVVTKINAIGEVEYTDASKALIDDARTAYDALTDAEKALVTADQLKVLTDAEEAYASLKAAAEAAANKGGCGGSIIAVSAMVSGLAFAGLALLSKKRKED